MNTGTVNLTPKLLRKLKQQEVDYLKSKEVRELYKDEPWKMMAYGVMLRHTNIVDYVRTPGVANYGVEIEYDLRPVDFLSVSEVKKSLAAGVRLGLIRAGWGTNFSLEEDSSVPMGFEVVLGPAPKDKVLRTILHVLGGWRLEDFTDFMSDDMGVHVTVDKYPHEHQKQLFMEVWNNKWTHILFHRLIGRAPNDYCRIMEKDEKGKYIADDYGIVRERKNGALEVRAFRHSGHHAVTMAQVRFVIKIDEWIRNGGTDLNQLHDEMGDWNEFRGINASKRC